MRDLTVSEDVAFSSAVRSPPAPMVYSAVTSQAEPIQTPTAPSASAAAT